MKKILLMALILCIILGLNGCGSKMPYDLKGTAEIEVYAYDSSSEEPFAQIIVDGQEEVSHLVDNFSSLKLKKMEHTDPCILGFEFWFKDANGTELAHISLTYGPWPWVIVGGTAYADLDSGIDLEFLYQLVDVTVTTVPRIE